jgi:DNA processing protein
VGGVSDDVLLARAFLSRVVEPAALTVWTAVRRDGPVAVAEAIRNGQPGAPITPGMAARAADADPYADLDVASRRGIRLVVPESDEWPHFAFSALEKAGERRISEYEQGARVQPERGELIPPLALWIRGPAELASVGVRSVAIVGSRTATEYGENIAVAFAAGLAERGFVVVSGGAYGIDAAAHRGALARAGTTVLVSAGGLDRPYPPGNARLFEQVADSGLLVSESPPGCDPRRRRFLTRNRLIAALGTGTVVVEAASRSGARNTARHCLDLGRQLMAVPGPVTSPMSAGCHRLLAGDGPRAELVTSVQDVLALVGAPLEAWEEPDEQRRDRLGLQDRLDGLDPAARRVFDGFPSRGWVDPDRLAVAAGLSPVAVVRALPMLELSGLVEASVEGYRLARPTAGTTATKTSADRSAISAP